MSPASHREGPRSTSDQSMCGLWRIKWHWKNFVLVLVLPLSVINYHSTSAPHTLTILGWYPRHISGRSTKTLSHLPAANACHKKVRLRSFLTLASDGDKWSTSRPDCCGDEKKFLPLPGIEPRYPDPFR